MSDQIEQPKEQKAPPVILTIEQKELFRQVFEDEFKRYIVTEQKQEVNRQITIATLYLINSVALAVFVISDWDQFSNAVAPVAMLAIAVFGFIRGYSLSKKAASLASVLWSAK